MFLFFLVDEGKLAINTMDEQILKGSSPAAMLFIVLLMQLAHTSSSAVCDWRNTTLAANMTVDVNCTEATFVDVVVAQNVHLAILVNSICASTPFGVVFLLANVTLSSHAVIIFNSSISNVGPNSPPLCSSFAADVRGIASSDGALVFQGTFPKRTTIRVQNGRMKATGNGTTFPAYTYPYSVYVNVVLLYNFALTHSSGFVVSNLVLESLSGPSKLIFIGGESAKLLSIANCSVFSVENTTFIIHEGSPGSSPLDIKPLMLITGSSLVQFANCTLESHARSGYGIVVESPLEIAYHSAFSISGTTSSTAGRSLFVTPGNGLLTIRDFSVMVISCSKRMRAAHHQ